MNEVCGEPSILARRRQLRFYLYKHCLDLGLHRRKLSGVARANDDIRVGSVLLIDEWIAADDCLGMRLGDGAELGADIAFFGVSADRLRQQFGAGLEFRRDLVEHRPASPPECRPS